MKKLLLIAIVLFASIQLSAQTDGISYQAVILNPNTQEIPGADVSGNILPNTRVSIRFTILDANNATEYQEVQATSTDQYGMINLLIGKVNFNSFTLISWDGTKKELKVEIDFKGGINFVDLSREQLTFLPFASHRNITASGTLKVDEATFLNGELTVQEPTTLNSTLDVKNESASNLTGDLTVGGATIIEGATNLNSSLDVNNKSITNLTGNLNVGENLEPNPSGEPFDEDATTKLNGALSVVGKSNFTTQETSGPAKFALLDANVLIIKQDVTKNPLIPASSTLNGDNKLLGSNYLEGINNLVGNNTFGAYDDNDKNTLIGTNILLGNNTIGNSFSDETAIKGRLSVNTDKQVKITSTLNGGQLDVNKYPLLVEGGNQGIAIKIAGNKNKSNNYISFWDDNTGKIWGKIQGETLSDLKNSDVYKKAEVSFALNTANAIAKAALSGIEAVFGGVRITGAATSVTGCVGFGACVTTPIPSLIAVETAGTILKVAKFVRYGLLVAKVAYQATEFFSDKEGKVGVTYLSGAGDYAEYLPKENSSADFIPGELVGVKNGFVSKDVWGAEKIMVVSTRPIVLGNMPQPNNEENSVKIAFMGQVPVRVIGTVAPGDYILPNLLANGIAKAVHPKDMKTRDYKRVAGVAWNIISKNSDISLVNVAVGINTNDLSDVVYQQEEELKTIKAMAEKLQTQMEESNTVLAKLVPGYAEAKGISSHLDSSKTGKSGVVHKEEENPGNVIDGTAYANDVVYFEVPRALIEEGVALARQTVREAQNSQNPINMLLANAVKESNSTNKTAYKVALDKSDIVNIDTDPFWQKFDSNPAYKEEIIQTISTNMEKAYHTHEKNAKNVNAFKIRKD